MFINADLRLAYERRTHTGNKNLWRRRQNPRLPLRLRGLSTIVCSFKISAKYSDERTGDRLRAYHMYLVQIDDYVVIHHKCSRGLVKTAERRSTRLHPLPYRTELSRNSSIYTPDQLNLFPHLALPSVDIYCHSHTGLGWE